MQWKRILLAVDPFTEEPEESAEKIARSISALVRERETIVEAAYLMTPNGFGIPLEKLPEYQDYYKNITTDLLKLAVSGFGKNVSTEITVLQQSSDSVRAAVESLLKHVAKQGVNLIALSTHARKGMDRLFLGSFTETLLLRTPVPLLITNPKTPWDPAFRHILFATDFAQGSLEAFDSAISFAKRVGAKITLFHRLDPESVVLPPPGFIVFQDLKERKIERQAKALKLKEKAEREGVQIEIEIDTEHHRVVPAILSAADRLKVSLIAMSARKSSEFLAVGSIPRKVVREAPCPVLILPVETKTE